MPHHAERMQAQRAGSPTQARIGARSTAPLADVEKRREAHAPFCRSRASDHPRDCGRQECVRNVSLRPMRGCTPCALRRSGQRSSAAGRCFRNFGTVVLQQGDAYSQMADLIGSPARNPTNSIHPCQVPSRNLESLGYENESISIRIAEVTELTEEANPW